ncbi:DHA2 family efflux MFS transporter permease subunit [Nocardioides sambongensis]|uniref:DHA2 family efflux MFS transporter permease subunit n=1 Tax=Nocardioides sambongensis TaxID=2589074 RepID=UPI001125D4F7|nr:DHA2 family efflux MFS transporter permease subunit [Nocardioides sambongensis]
MATDASAENAAPDDDKLDKSVLLTAGVVVLGAIMSILDITVVSVALETFQEEFDATSAEVAWTMTGYTLALATVIPLTGWASDRFGTKRLYLLAVTLFTIGSILCAVADSLPMLVGFRVVQGLGGGMLMPLGMTILTRAAGPHRVGRVMAIMGIPMLLGPIFGPILGGWLIEAASWHWIFLINLPIGIAAIIYASIVLPKDNVEPSETFDFVGMLLLSPGLALFLYGVSSIPEAGTVWDAEVLATGIAGLVLIGLFVPWALNQRNVHPLVDLRLFANKNMTVAIIAMALFAIAFFGASLLFPLYFQQVRDESALSAGALLAPQGIGAMLTMPIAGTIADRKGPGRVVMVGICLVTLGMGLFTQLDEGTSYAYILGALFVMGMGMGATMMPIMSAALATLTAHSTARGTTLLNITQQTAASIGTALFSVILTNSLNGKDQAALGAANIERLAGDPERLDTLAQMTGIPLQQLQAMSVDERLSAVAQGMGVTLDQFQALAADGLAQMADSFATVFIVGTALVACCLIPAFFLPRKAAEEPVDPAMMMGH